MWSIPHRIKTRQLNLYTLETLNGLPLAGVYNARQLRAIIPHEGTKLATEELAHFKTSEELEELHDEENVGSVEVETGLGIVTRASL